MTKTQLDNLIRFSFLFKTMDYQKQSPDYIKEKWDSYISMPIPQLDSHLEDSIKWKKIWNADDSMLTLIDFLNHNDSVAFVSDSPSDIINRFGSIFDVNKIKDESYNGLHNKLDNALDIWIKNSLRDYNLCLLI